MFRGRKVNISVSPFALLLCYALEVKKEGLDYGNNCVCKSLVHCRLVIALFSECESDRRSIYMFLPYCASALSLGDGEQD